MRIHKLVWNQVHVDRKYTFNNFRVLSSTYCTLFILIWKQIIFCPDFSGKCFLTILVFQSGQDHMSWLLAISFAVWWSLTPDLHPSTPCHTIHILLAWSLWEQYDYSSSTCFCIFNLPVYPKSLFSSDYWKCSTTTFNFQWCTLILPSVCTDSAVART